MTEQLTQNGEEGQYSHSAVLNQVDAIMAVEVFTDALNKFVLLQELAPKIEQHKDEITVYVGKEIERIIDRQGVLSAQFQSGIQARDEAVSAGQSRDEVRGLNERVQALARRIQESTQELCKNLKENPSVTENIGKTQQHRSDYMELVEKALQEFKTKQSYYQLESDVSQQFNVFQEHKSLALREQKSRQQVEELLKEIAEQKLRHGEFMKAHTEELSKLKENLVYTKERVSQCLGLLEKELEAADDEMRRLRGGEFAAQKKALENLLAQIDVQIQTDEQMNATVQQMTEEMQQEAQRWGQAKEQNIKLLEMSRIQLEKEREEKDSEIRRLEDQCNRNKQEKKQWEEQKAFDARMKGATLEARKIRLETSRAYLQKQWDYSLCVPKKKGAKKGGIKM